MEYNDLYDENRRPLGRTHLRGTPLKEGEYTLVVCCWVCDRQGRLLLTKRAEEKEAFPGYWENSGGSAQAGETSRQAIVREVWEETGISAKAEEYVFLKSERGERGFYDFYMLVRDFSLEEVRLQPGETCDKRLVTFAEAHEMVARGLFAEPVAKRFLRQEKMLLERLYGSEK